MAGKTIYGFNEAVPTETVVGLVSCYVGLIGAVSESSNPSPILPVVQDGQGTDSYITDDPANYEGRGLTIIKHNDETVTLVADNVIVRKKILAADQTFQNDKMINGNLIVSNTGGGKVQGWKKLS